MKAYYAAWAGLVVACIGDIVTTAVGINLLGLTEKNQAMVPLFESIGVLPAMIVTTIAFLAFVVVGTTFMLETNTEYSMAFVVWTLCGTAAVKYYAAINNAYLIGTVLH